jgi:hypothetical protein
VNLDGDLGSRQPIERAAGDDGQCHGCGDLLLSSAVR